MLKVKDWSLFCNDRDYTQVDSLFDAFFIFTFCQTDSVKKVEFENFQKRTNQGFIFQPIQQLSLLKDFAITQDPFNLLCHHLQIIC